MKEKIKEELDRVIEFHGCIDIDDVFWPNIGYNMSLSKDFIREFKDKLDLPGLFKNGSISESFYIEMMGSKYLIKKIDELIKDSEEVRQRVKWKSKEEYNYSEIINLLNELKNKIEIVFK